MIKVNHINNKLVISGHANFSDSNDIVCASFSSIVYTSLNSILELDKDSIKYSDDGYIMTLELLNDNKNSIKLFNVLIKLIKSLEKQYPKNISYESEDK